MYRILPAVFLALALAVVPAAAGDIYTPDNQPAIGTCNSIPWSSTEYCYQALIPASMMGGKAARIYEISFTPCGTGTFNASACEIRFAHWVGTTVSTTFATNLQKDNTLVYQGALSYPYVANTWSDVGLTTGFNYNGTDGLVVELRYRGGSGGTSFHRSSTITRLYTGGAGTFTATTGGGQGLAALKMRFKTIDISITASGTPSPGQTINFDLSAPADGSLFYQVASSLGKGPIALGNRTLELTPDELMKVSVNNLLPMIFVNYSKQLDAQGKGKASLKLPAIPALVGVRFYTAFVTLDVNAPLGIKNISPTATISIR